MKQISVRVNEMKIEIETDYETPGMPKRDVVKVYMLQVSGAVEAGLKGACLLATVPHDAPNPFVLGQRLQLTIEDAPASEIGVQPVVPLAGANVEVPARDEVFGLWAQFDRDVMAEAPATPVAV